MTQILKAMAFAHSMNIFHSDIKPENIFAKGNGTIKIADFGIAQVLALIEESIRIQTAGSFHYMPPEAFKRARVSEKSDIWALACMVIEMASGKKAFPGKNSDEVKPKVLQSDPCKMPESYSLDLRKLVWRMSRTLGSEDSFLYITCSEVSLYNFGLHYVDE